jgi:hypothetical protein
MKKILLILLLFIYTSSTFGMVVKEFYCCGKLSSISVSFTYLNEKSEKQNKGCCKTQYHSSKANDNHIVPAAISFIAKHFENPAIAFPVFTTIAFNDSKIVIANGIHDPPLLHNSTPLYILIRDLRV